MIRRFLFFVVLMLPVMGLSQVNIKVTVKGRQDGMFHLYRYRGSKMAVADSAYCRNGKLRFVHLKDYPQGIYLLTDSENLPVTEILIGDKQTFSMKIKENEYTQTIKVQGSRDTKLYFDLMERERKHDMLERAILSDHELWSCIDSRFEALSKLNTNNQDILNYEESLIDKRNGSFFNLFVNSMKRKDKEHFWDDFQLDDARILTYPLIDKRLEEYFNNLPPNAELINGEIDKLIAKTGDCEEVRDYLLWYFCKKYSYPDKMNLEDIYIHLVDDYFLKLEMDNVSESMLNMMADRARYLEDLKIGARFPNIENLYTIEASYITVFFYDNHCMKCAKEGYRLKEIGEKYPEMVYFMVEVNSTDVKDLLMKYDIQSTPMIYVLDGKKRIIAKGITVEKVEHILKMD